MVRRRHRAITQDDPPQTRQRADKITRAIAREQVDDLRAALSHPPTRRVFMRLLFAARCDVAHLFEENVGHTASTWDPTVKIHFNAGERAIGLLLMRWIKAADRQAWPRLVAEDLAYHERLEALLAAADTPPLTEQGSV